MRRKYCKNALASANGCSTRIVAYPDTIFWCVILSSRRVTGVPSCLSKATSNRGPAVKPPESRPTKHHGSTRIAHTFRELAAVSGV
jgi:hypothetical protein